MSGSPRASTFNVPLNGYRGLCALAVFCYHLGSAGVVAWPAGTDAAEMATFLWSSLRYGVEMFFMISGYVILGSLLRHPTVGGFLKDRFVRIFSAWAPTLIAVTAVCIAFDMKMFTHATPLEAAGIFVANLFLLPPFAPVPMVHFGSWSLSYEWVFYLTAAAGVLLWRRPANPRWVTCAWIAAAVLFVLLFPRALFFLTGILVFRYQAWFAQHRAWLRMPGISLLVFLLAWRATQADAAELTVTFFHWIADGRWLAAVIAFAASVHLFASICLAASRGFAFLEGRAFQFLGTVSYSFYLWHGLVMAFVKRAVEIARPVFGDAATFTLFVLLSSIVSLAVSWLSWRWLETALGQAMRRTLAPRLPLRSVHAA